MKPAKTWPASKLIPVVVLTMLYAAALYGAMKMLAALNAGIAIATAVLIIAGMAVALAVVVNKARAAGHQPADIESTPPSLLSIIAVMAGSMAVFIVCTLNLAVGLALVSMVVFAFMGALILIPVFARVEIATRARVGLQPAGSKS